MVRRSAALAMLLFASVPLAAQEPSPPLEEGFFELVVQRLPERPTLTVVVDGTGRVLLPLRPILELVGVPISASADTLVLEWPPDLWRTALHAPTRALVRGDSVTAVPPEAWRVHGGESYVDAATLEGILAARVHVDWADLVVTISENLAFPAVLRLAQEARREAELRRSGVAAPGLEVLPYAPRTGGMVANWGLSLAESEGQSRASARVSAGASVWGGAFESGITAVGGDPGTDLDDGFLRWSRVFPGEGPLRQLHLGDFLTEGPVGHRVVGVSVSNEPFTTPRSFGEAVLQPDVPTGWEYEVYQGEHLVGVSTSGGEPLSATLGYGNTPVRVRMLGPAGQEVVEELLFVVPPGRVPAGEWRYAAGAGACRETRCRSYAYGELRRGLTPWLTLGAGTDRRDDGVGDPSLRPYAMVGVSPTPSLIAELQAQRASFLRTTLQYATGSRGSLSATFARNRSSGSDLAFEGWHAQLAASGPLALAGGRWMAARLLARRADGADGTAWQGSVSTTVRRTWVGLEFESGVQRSDLLSVRTFTPLGEALDGRLRDLALSVAAGASRDGPDLLELGGSARLAGSTTFSADVRMRDGVPPTLSLGIVARTGAGYAQARATHGTGTGVFLSADGGVALGAGGSPLLLPFQSLGRSGISGAVFEDDDGDGVRDPGEAPAANVRVVVAGDGVMTDEEGRFRAWEVMPYDPAVVSVDSLTLPFGWAPAPRQVPLRPSPNVFNPVQLPLVRTRELTGRVELTDTLARPLGGVGVELLDAAGEVVLRARTFSDGVFYVQRVRPGVYRLRVAPSTAAALGAVPVPAEVELVIPAEGAAPVDAGVLRLRPVG